jgi:hypothetical protein
MKREKIKFESDFGQRPKGPVSSFFLYYKYVAKDLMDKNKSVPGSQLVKIASSNWKNLTQV